jgi:AcrR family transcriptional regulator
MPRTRAALERDSKVQEILAVAARRLRSDGYEALSVAAIARELGLSPNSIYWYFPNKDQLFVSAVRHMLGDILASKPPGRRSLERRILWFAERLDEIEHLRGALYERARRSAVVADFARELEGGARQLTAGALAGHVDDADLQIATEALLMTLDGATLRDASADDRRRVISYTLRRFTSAG